MMRNRLAFVFKSALGVAVMLTAALSSVVHAQQQPPGARPPTPTPAARANEADANADLSITARVTADSLRFEKVPNTHVEFTGKPERVTVWEAERENLPRPVQPGVTYRNIGITLRITSVFADIDRIVAEALGEVPVNDGAQPPPPQPSPAQPTPPRPEQPAAPAAAPANPPARAAAAAPRRRPSRGGRGN